MAEGTIVEEGTSKTGIPYVIRYPKTGDVESVLRFVNRLSKERTYVRLEGEELTLEEEEEYVRKKIAANEEKRSVTLFLIVDGEVQGNCGIDRKTHTESHVGSLHISVDESARGQGLGEALMRSVMSEAVRVMEGLRIIRLTLKAPNERAKKLYEKLGFEEFGTLPGGTSHRGEYFDEFYMYKKLS